jgi:glycosyltransferase involved in cell wall biosynthesis
LLIGPFTPPYTGQSVAFSYLKKIESNELEFEFHNTKKFRNFFLNYFSSVFFLPLRILCTNYALIYFIGSRSKFGFLRQVPFLLTSIILRKKIINHLHGSDFYDFYQKSSFLKPLVKLCYDRVDTSIVLLEAMKKEFVDFPHMKTIVVSNAYNAEFNQLKVPFPKPCNLLYLSNIMASKGILVFLEAAFDLLKNNQNLTIKIAGAFLGDHLKNKSQIKQDFFEQLNHLQNTFPNRIEYLGVVVGDQKVKCLVESTIFILPTFYPTEAAPISIIEAMRTGNAIITTKHNYLDMLVSKKNGVLISTHSTEEIISATEQLLDDPKLLQEIQRHNVEESKNKYSIKNHLINITNVIRESI